MPNGTKCLKEQNVQAKLTSLLYNFYDSYFFLFSSTSFLGGTSWSYFFPPTLLLTLHEIFLYVFCNNYTKYIKMNSKFLNSLFISLSFFLSVFSLYMKFPYILTSITSSIYLFSYLLSLSLSLSLLSLFYLSSLSLSSVLSFFSLSLLNRYNSCLFGLKCISSFFSAALS